MYAPAERAAIVPSRRRRMAVDMAVANSAGEDRMGRMIPGTDKISPCLCF